MPKEKPPPFPIGLTVDEALQRGWRPGLGRPLFAGDDEVIREPGPGDGCIAPQPRRRRQTRSSDSPRARIKPSIEPCPPPHHHRNLNPQKQPAPNLPSLPPPD